MFRLMNLNDKNVKIAGKTYIIKTSAGKSILQVPDTGTRVLDNTRPFLSSSIVSF